MFHDFPQHLCHGFPRTNLNGILFRGEGSGKIEISFPVRIEKAYTFFFHGLLAGERIIIPCIGDLHFFRGVLFVCRDLFPCLFLFPAGYPCIRSGYSPLQTVQERCRVPASAAGGGLQPEYRVCHDAGYNPSVGQILRKPCGMFSSSFFQNLSQHKLALRVTGGKVVRAGTLQIIAKSLVQVFFNSRKNISCIKCVSQHPLTGSIFSAGSLSENVRSLSAVSCLQTQHGQRIKRRDITVSGAVFQILRRSFLIRAAAVPVKKHLSDPVLQECQKFLFRRVQFFHSRAASQHTHRLAVTLERILSKAVRVEDFTCSCKLLRLCIILFGEISVHQMPAGQDRLVFFLGKLIHPGSEQQDCQNPLGCGGTHRHELTGPVAVPDKQGIVFPQLIQKFLPDFRVQGRLPFRTQEGSAFFCHFLHKLYGILRKKIFNPGPYPAAVFLSVEKPGVIGCGRKPPQIFADLLRKYFLHLLLTLESKAAFRGTQNLLILDLFKDHVDRKRSYFASCSLFFSCHLLCPRYGIRVLLPCLPEFFSP